MKKLLMLGGAYAQVPAIKRAKEMGYYVITCDYLPLNPGHAFADEYVNISTTDKEAVLRFAEKKDIAGVIAYASDPSALTAAYISDALRLSGSSYQAVRLLGEKDLFRQFQKENGFYAPDFVSIAKIEELAHAVRQITYPCMVKPVDSSGSKGVSKIHHRRELQQAVQEAFRFTRCGRVIIEQYIETPFHQLHGDGVVIDGKLAFAALGEQHFSNSAPIGTSFPASINPAAMNRIYKEVSRVIERSGYTSGGINIEVRVTARNEICVIEIGPRTGGNYIPQLMELATGEDEMTAVLRLAMGEPCSIRETANLQCCFQYIIGSEVKGKFKELYMDDATQEKITALYLHKKAGEQIDIYENSGGVVGVALLKFKSIEEMEQDIKEINRHIRVLVEGEKHEGK